MQKNTKSNLKLLLQVFIVLALFATMSHYMPHDELRGRVTEQLEGYKKRYNP